MQINSSELKFIVGNADVLDKMPETAALPLFSDKAMTFLSALSSEILHDKRSRAFADVVSYAYWIRKASLEKAKQNHKDCGSRIGRGVAFNIAPSNVPVNFAFSMTLSALAGNASLIRLSNKPFEQVNIICDCMNRLLDGEFSCMKPYFCILRYEHSDEITRVFSSICDVRIIWGGNRTIEAIRNAPLPPRAVEMSFADRHSIAVIDSDAYLKENSAEVAKGFYTDTYYTDQNACTSPRLVVWTGSRREEAKKRFWSELEALVEKDYSMKPIQAVDKFSSFCTYAMKQKGLHLVSDNNFIVRVYTDQLTADMMNYKNGGGYFFEYDAEELKEIVPVLTKQCQTVSVLGIPREEIKKLVFEYGVKGVDRIVSLGQTMSLEFIWDGYKMIENMSRFVYT